MTYGRDNYSRWHVVNEARRNFLPDHTYAYALCDDDRVVWPLSKHRPPRLCCACQDALKPKPPAGPPVKQGVLFNDL